MLSRHVGRHTLGKRQGFMWAFSELMKGTPVTRFEARWLLQLVEKSIIRYRLDGGGNRIFEGHATLSSADMLSNDWVEYIP
jgi:hypothetical protein